MQPSHPRGSRILVCGAGGFIGGHLVARLLAEGFEVRAVDRKPQREWWQVHDQAQNIQVDLQLRDDAKRVVSGVDQVYNLAADMGGIGFIANNKALCMLSVLINTHLLAAAQEAGVQRFFYSSSACVYNVDLQQNPDIGPLSEADAYPAMPEDGYGWEKLFGERLCRHFREDFGLETRVARYHNVYGPNGTWDGGREKAPAAICRKVVLAQLSGDHTISIWGDGEQTRSFMYVDDCVEGTRRLMDSDFHDPLNIGRDELVTINQLVDLAEGFAGITLQRSYDLSKPRGVAGRNSDTTLIQTERNWAPPLNLAEGLERTYSWIHDQIVSGRTSHLV
jgi:nucleoside-diphosphate-sugar epimerase